MAHLVEYAALGSTVMLLVLSLRVDFGNKYFGIALFYTLIIAVLDEHIQSFSDRTSSTGDILLDFFGALIGFCFVLLAQFIIKKVKERKNNRIEHVC